jgi:protoporphyrinogen oxidase
LATVPYPILSKIYQLEKNNLTGLAARTLVLELDAPFFSDQTYWLSIHEKNWPFLAVVEHTNLVNRAHYGGKNMVYVGKYLSRESEFYKLSLDKVLEQYAPYLEQLSPGWGNHVTNKWLFSADFAQPLVYQNHSQSLPKVELLKNKLYWLSMQHVYPWDRGINYAVKFGRSITNYLRNE